MNGPAPHTSAVVQGAGGGNNLKRIIVIIFGLVLVLVLAEIGYYFYTKSIQDRATNQGAAPSVPGFPTAPPGGAKDINYEKAYQFVENLETSSETPALYKEAFFRRVLQGEVVSAEPIDKLFGGISHVFAITIEEEGGQKLRINYNNKDVETAKVNIVSPNGEREPIKLTDIKVGDFAAITETLNFLDSSADIEIAIDVTRAE